MPAAPQAPPVKPPDAGMGKWVPLLLVLIIVLLIALLVTVIFLMKH
jgi:ABC-type Na+ efflux pump permease subunit